MVRPRTGPVGVHGVSMRCGGSAKISPSGGDAKFFPTRIDVSNVHLPAVLGPSGELVHVLVASARKVLDQLVRVSSSRALARHGN